MDCHLVRLLGSMPEYSTTGVQTYLRQAKMLPFLPRESNLPNGRFGSQAVVQDSNIRTAALGRKAVIPKSDSESPKLNVCFSR